MALAAVSPEAMAPAAVSPRVGGVCCRTSRAPRLSSAPCVVVVHSNELLACHDMVEETITELRIYPVKENVDEFSLFPDASVTTTSAVSELSVFVETLDATAVEPLEVSVVSTYPLSTCPVMVKETICELSACPVTTKEVVFELSACPVLVKRAVPELSARPVTAKDTVSELSFSKFCC